ncbi:uncharacterized protein LOC115875983 isoform X2 [Sitophilus oryzae]|nr:uncharacterized protein LOC115875983 isoform X2 [Sitophilus oryzae]XP_030747486.1 uncharacterized protein LOC115875983 isoform X2 [Sitophilus oryzae]
MSQSTSYQTKDYFSETELLTEPFTAHKYAQKFRRESEIKRYEPKRRKFRRGTLESHSFTNIYQPVLKDFYFGSRQGTMHQGDEHLPENARNMQGLCIPVAAYCFSFLKHPNKWTAEMIDEILDVGSTLYLSSLSQLHYHKFGKELKPEDLAKYCLIREKKVKFTVEDPEVSGLIKSSDKTVFNLTKALNVFFARQKAGILQTQDTNLIIWKDKYFYFFDGKPRTKDLHYSPNGTALMATLYDISAIVTILLQRSGLQNWPFVIYPIKVYKILGKDDEDDEDKHLGMEARSNYNILNESKAVLLGSYDLGDKCFGFTRNKQSLPMAVVCLVYSRITPPSAWHKQTVEKIMTIGNQLYVECMQCESIKEMALNVIPAFFTVGPYIVEIYIYTNRLVDVMYEKCNCQLKCSFEEFFQTNTNALLQIGPAFLAVWRQRNMFFCFDPYSRGMEGYSCRDGYACVSMHANLESLVDVITHNFENKDSVFNLHALKVCKIHRDPVQSERFPKHIPLDEFPADEFKIFKMRKSRKPATEKPVTVDYSALAMRSLLMGETPDPSVFEIGSTVESLGLEQIPPLLHPGKTLPYHLLQNKPNISRDVIADLDSPSLSDTQIVPPRPSQGKEAATVPFMDLDSFELTQEEIELEEMAIEGSPDKYEGMEEFEKEYELEGDMEQEMEDQGGEDFYYTEDRDAQVRTESLLPVVTSGEMNTELTFFSIKKEVLYPTLLRGKQRMKTRPFKSENKWEDLFVPLVPDVTKSEELRKETNFVNLPDDTQIIRGTKNIADFGEETEFMAPFICVMADVVAKKYSILSWNSDIVDYVLKCGTELYKASKFRYDQVSKLEIPQISLGKMKYACLVEYVFDSYTRENILELAIGKILFVRSDMGVLVTPTYACALIYKNHLYYMYDGFGNNEVGLSEGLSDDGTACFSRFKDIHALVTRIMYNKRKRESLEEVVYTRFVLSLVKVKRLHPSEERLAKDKEEPQRQISRQISKQISRKSLKQKSKTNKSDWWGPVKSEEEQIAAQSGEDEIHGNLHGEKSQASDEDDDKPDAENKVGYRYENGYYVIKGTRAMESSGDDANDEAARAGTAELTEDHFCCICACLMLLSCPVEKWDTKKIDEVLDHGAHIYSHADDLEMSDKRTIKNILIQKNFFDIIVKKVKIENWKDNKNLSTGIDTLLRKKMAYFLIQFPDKCYVVHKSATDETFHIFFPCNLPKKSSKDEKNAEGSSENVAGWLKCKTLKQAKKRLKEITKKGSGSYDFYTFQVTSIRKAPKDMLINYRLNQHEMAKRRKSEKFGKPFYEDAKWLLADPIPWSRAVNKSPAGHERGTISNLWHNWDIEYDKDLYSLVGTINQESESFPEESRGKQTLCSLVICVGMLYIYDFTEWNTAVVDSIITNADAYFQECVADIKNKDYELSFDDLNEDYKIFPFAFKVAFRPVVEGTMFLVRNTQFNLYKALRLFFDHYDRRAGVIYCTKSETNKKQIAFGKTQRHEYFMFEADPRGGTMFLEGTEKAYILRATSLNRLLHVLTLTLRGGDFYIYEVDITEMNSIPMEDDA